MDNQEPGYFEKTEKLLQQYVSNRLLLFKLKITEKTSYYPGKPVIGFFVEQLRIPHSFISKKKPYRNEDEGSQPHTSKRTK